MRHLSLDFPSRIDSSILSQLFENLPTIEYLTLNGILSNINLDSLINLKSLNLIGIVDKYFNFSLFENICNRLEILSIELNQFKDIYRMFEGHDFSNLNSLYIIFCFNITKLEKKFFDGFRMLQKLTIHSNRQLREVDFSDLKQLIALDLSTNQITSLERKHFSGLEKLKYLNLKGNKIESIEENVFSSLKNLEVLDLSWNMIEKLSANSFAELSNLKHLNLNYNKLKNFD